MYCGIFADGLASRCLRAIVITRTPIKASITIPRDKPTPRPILSSDDEEDEEGGECFVAGSLEGLDVQLLAGSVC